MNFSDPRRKRKMIKECGATKEGKSEESI